MCVRLAQSALFSRPCAESIHELARIHTVRHVMRCTAGQRFMQRIGHLFNTDSAEIQKKRLHGRRASRVQSVS